MDRKEKLDLIFDHLVKDVDENINIANPGTGTRALFAIAIAIRGLWSKSDNANNANKLGDVKELYCQDCRKKTSHINGAGKRTGRLYWECLECRKTIYQREE